MPRVSKQAIAPAEFPSNTLIIDNGAYSIKTGFAPENNESDEQTLTRCHTIPNAVVRTRDRKTYIAAEADENISQWSEAIFRRPVEHGQIVSWEVQKAIWQHTFLDQKTARSDLRLNDPQNTTLILTEHPNMLPALEKNADEIVMEDFGFGGYLRINGQSLNAYNDLHPLFEGCDPAVSDSLSQLPMECLLVIDSGYSHTVVTPVLNGRAIQRAIRRLDFGGKHLTNLLKEMISIRHFDLHQDTKIVNDVKEDVSFVSKEFSADMEATRRGKRSTGVEVEGTNDIRVDYILPDGIHLLRGYSRPHDPSAAAARKRKANSLIADSEISMTLGNERFVVPEIIFTPGDIGSRQPGLPDMVMQSLATLPPLIQATMLSNVLVVGGNANIPGFVDRVQSELRMLVKTEWAVRVRKLSNAATSTWLGGARLASQHKDVVRQYGVTREEYFEHGSGWMARRFMSGS